MGSDIASWIQALASIGALVAAVAAALVARNLHRLAANEDRRNEKDQQDRFEADRLRKASGVAVWWACRISDETYGLLLSNRTDGVVHQLSAKGAVRDQAADGVWRFLPPGDLFAPKPFGPKAPRGFKFPEALEPGQEYRPVMSTDIFVVKSISFTDDAQIRWERDENGILGRVGGPE